MKCRECVEAGQQSRVYDMGSTTTAMGWRPFWDEDEVYHEHDPNAVQAVYRCSNGHEFERTMLRACPARGCPHGKNPEQVAEEMRPPCCGGGPQWGHAWDCRTLP